MILKRVLDFSLFYLFIMYHDSSTSLINFKFKINTSISVAGRFTRTNRTYHIQRRKKKQFQAGSLEIEEGRASQSWRMEIRNWHQRYKHGRFLRNHKDQYYTRSNDKRGNNIL